MVLYFGLRYNTPTRLSQERNYESFTVVVPFRNERERMQQLIDSINEADYTGLNIEFIFVDDHSTDDSADLLKGLQVEYKLIVPPSQGKKFAIQAAVIKAEHNRILTLDADVVFDVFYFQCLSHLKKRDMWILPVRMNGDRVISKLGSIDFSWIQMLTYVFGNGKKAVLANGANLFFDRAKFIQVDGERTDYQIASGDDVFLMSQFQEKGFTMAASNFERNEVRTKAPANYRKLVNQRKRWAGKMAELVTGKTELMTIAMVLVQLAFFTSIVELIRTQDIIWLWLLLFKMGNEYIFLRFYKKEKELILDMPIVVLHQLFFPYYLISIVLAKRRDDYRWVLEQNQPR